MALGPVIGGYLITRYGEIEGVRYAFIAALVMALISMIFQETMIHEPEKKAPEKADESEAQKPLLRPELKRLLIADILVRFCEQIPYPFVVLWCMNVNKVSGIELGVLSTIEMATAVLIYIPVAWLADRGTKKPFVTMTFVFFTIFPLFLLYSKSFWMLSAAFFIRGLKEFGEPTRKALIMDLAPEGRKAAAFGTYYLYRDIVVSVGAFSGAILWEISPQANFIGAFVCGLIGTLWFHIKGTDMAVVESGEIKIKDSRFR